MEYVTTGMLVTHTGKTKYTIYAAVKAAGVRREKFPGVQGFRIEKREANKFLLKHWPEVGPLPAVWPRRGA